MSLLAASALVLGLGVSQSGHQPENHWFQQRYPHELSLTSPSVSLAVETSDWRLSATRIVTAKTHALADPDDSNYNPDLSDPNPCLKACLVPVDQLPVWRGSGSLDGIAISYKWKINSHWFIEFGAEAQYARWTQYVDGWYPPDRPDERRDLVVKHNRWAVKPLLSIGYIATSNVSAVIEVRPWIQQGGQYPPIFKTAVVTASIRVRF